MADVLKKQSSKKMLIIGLAAGMVIAAPLGYRAYANEGTNEQKDEAVSVSVPPLEEQSLETSVEQSATVTADEAVTAEVAAAAQTTVTTTTPEVDPAPVEPGEQESADPAAVADLQAAIGIAVAEHGGSKVVSAKVKTLGAETVYKVTFEDGFSAYVSADDGEVLILKDKHGKHRKVHSHAKQAWMNKYHNWDARSEQFRAWAVEWLKQHPWFAEQLAALLRQWQPVAPAEPTQPEQPVEETTPEAPTAEVQASADVSSDRRDKHARVDGAARYKDKTRNYGAYGNYYSQYQNPWARR